jgi:hypothetical protein
MTKDDRAFADTVVGAPEPDSRGLAALTLDVSTDPGSTADLGPGETYEVLASRWEMRGLIGAGGMGTVYRAYDRELDEFVALKILKGELVSRDLVERFRRGAPLNAGDPATFYGGGEKGYTDYPTLAG